MGPRCAFNGVVPRGTLLLGYGLEVPDVPEFGDTHRTDEAQSTHPPQILGFYLSALAQG